MTLLKIEKPVSRLPLTKQCKAQRVKWATDYIKCDFSTVTFKFTVGSRPTLDGLDGSSRGRIYHVLRHRLALMYYYIVLTFDIQRPFIFLGLFQLLTIICYILR